MPWPERTFCRGIGECGLVSFLGVSESWHIHTNKTQIQSLSRLLEFKNPIFKHTQKQSMQQNTISANQDDVREEWEKVKLSYEILIDRKSRLKYDRNSVVADPGAAVGRAVGGAVGSVFSWGVESVFRMVAGEKGGVDSVDGNDGGGNGSREAVET
jgi:hypothetical protein